MKIFSVIPCLAALALLGAAAPQKAAAKPAAKKAAAAKPAAVVMEAEKAQFDASAMKVADRERFSGKKGLMIADGRADSLAKPDPAKPDVTFKFTVKTPGRYWLRSACDTTGTAREAMKKAKNKFQSLQVKLAIDDGIVRTRYIISPWEDQNYRERNLMKWDFAAGEHTVKMWLPKDCALDKLTVAPYYPPRVPKQVLRYKPEIVPGPHPRLWVSPKSLPAVKENLTKGENKQYWDQVRAEAAKPFDYRPAKGIEGEYNTKLHTACVNKAFVYLMTGDRKAGEEAVKLMNAYIGVVEFSNILDITREIGQVIYSASLVYDWCYDLFTPAERAAYRAKLLRLAQDMEIGWPPFLQSIVNGHGNELQVNRDLLSMAIAVYGDDNTPYQYCAYRMFEELVPMRAEEYKSGRHNQGVGYGTFRFGAEMCAAWLLRRMADKEIFDPNIKSLGYYWVYMILPDARVLLDGDGSATAGKWASPTTMFYSYSYANDPILKGEFVREGSTVIDPVVFLLLNDPALKADCDFTKLPLTRNFPGVLPSIVARTGWNISETSNDAVVEMKGGDTHFGNHQHMDAGSFQIYYRGELATDLGLYGFYGTPYDMGFNKRSIAHNTLLAYDPTEVFLQKRYANDGGQRFIQAHPRSVAEMAKPMFRYGKTLGAYVGPSEKRPYFSFIWSDITQAYSDKVGGCTRAMCFLNLADQDCPAAMIVVDRMATRTGVKKYWILNSLTKPVETPNGVEIYSQRDFMRGRLSMHMFLPREVKREIVGGGNAASFFGQKLTPVVPGAAQAMGYRTMFSPAQEQDTETFAAVMLIGMEKTRRPAVSCKQNWHNLVFTIGDRLVVMPSRGKPQDTGFRFTVPAGRKHYCLLTGLQSGLWNVCGGKGKKINIEATVLPEQSAIFMQLDPGEYVATPGASADELRYTPPAPEVPETPNRYQNATYANGKVLPGCTLLAEDGVLMIPAKPVAEALGGKVKESGRTLAVSFGKLDAEFTDGERTFRLGSGPITMHKPAAKTVRGAWYIQIPVIAGLANAHFLADAATASAIFQTRDTQDELLWVDSNCNFTADVWRRMQGGTLTKSNYWAVNGAGQTFEVTFRQVRQLDGIGIEWAQGMARKAKFKLEVSDGKAWKTVYDGWSYQKGGLEIYPFPAQAVRQIRWTGYGNTVNTWNSIFSFVPQEVKTK